MNVSLFQAVSDELRTLGLVLEQAPGEYRVNFPHGTAETEFITDDLQDALDRGREMAEKPPPLPELPFGPMGHRTRRGAMYRHNKAVAARRGHRR